MYTGSKGFKSRQPTLDKMSKALFCPMKNVKIKKLNISNILTINNDIRQ